jgi:hypothetical protein
LTRSYRQRDAIETSSGASSSGAVGTRVPVKELGAAIAYKWM